MSPTSVAFCNARPWPPSPRLRRTALDPQRLRLLRLYLRRVRALLFANGEIISHSIFAPFNNLGCISQSSRPLSLQLASRPFQNCVWMKLLTTQPTVSDFPLFHILQ